MITAIVPVKDLSQAKQRLAELLTQAERQALCLAMLVDVLKALKGARRLDDIVVFSPDPDVLALTENMGIAAVRELQDPAGAAEEPEDMAAPGSSALTGEPTTGFDARTTYRANGQSLAVLAALPICADRGATAILTIPVDTPLLAAEDVDALIGYYDRLASQAPSALIVPSADGTGTNALLLTPPDALPPMFGPHSCARHIAEARRRRISYRRFELPGLALDIDSPADLAAFIVAAENNSRHSNNTYKHLLAAGLIERCRAQIIDPRSPGSGGKL